MEPVKTKILPQITFKLYNQYKMLTKNNYTWEISWPIEYKTWDKILMQQSTLKRYRYGNEFIKINE
jgi:hypothetical protein